MAKRLDSMFVPSVIHFVTAEYKISRATSLFSDKSVPELWPCAVVNANSIYNTLLNKHMASDTVYQEANTPKTGFFVLRMKGHKVFISHKDWMTQSFPLIAEMSVSQYERLIKQGPLESLELQVVVKNSYQYTLATTSEILQLNLKDESSLADKLNPALHEGYYYSSHVYDGEFLYLGIDAATGKELFFHPEFSGYIRTKEQVYPERARSVEPLTACIKQAIEIEENGVPSLERCFSAGYIRTMMTYDAYTQSSYSIPSLLGNNSFNTHVMFSTPDMLWELVSVWLSSLPEFEKLAQQVNIKAPAAEEPKRNYVEEVLRVSSGTTATDSILEKGIPSYFPPSLFMAAIQASNLQVDAPLVAISISKNISALGKVQHFTLKAFYDQQGTLLQTQINCTGDLSSPILDKSEGLYLVSPSGLVIPFNDNQLEELWRMRTETHA